MALSSSIPEAATTLYRFNEDIYVELVYCPTNKMLANVFTKGLAQEKLNKMRKLCVVDYDEQLSKREKVCWH